MFASAPRPTRPRRPAATIIQPGHLNTRHHVRGDDRLVDHLDRVAEPHAA